jgi:DNA polymerase III alpha subunit
LCKFVKNIHMRHLKKHFKKISVLFILLFYALSSFSQVEVSVADLIAQPEKYHKKEVTVIGYVANYKEKVSKRGNLYTVFKLYDNNDYISVFSFGYKGLKNGEKVKVTGEFYQVKRVGRYTFYNEINMKDYSVLKE